jgi:fatty acid CoA ligase FadD9
VRGSTIRWTVAEAHLMAEMARRSIVASLDGAPPVSAGAGRFRSEIHAGPEVITLELVIDADHAIVRLGPDPLGHRWRDSWVLELVREAPDGSVLDRWSLASHAVAEITSARSAKLRVHLRYQQRAIARELAGTLVTVPVADVAFHRYTNQSTIDEGAVAPGGSAPWALATQREPAPWWEIDLGTPRHVVFARLDLATPPPGTRIVVRAYGFALPDGSPPPGSELIDVASEMLPVDEGRTCVVVTEGIVARYLRLQLVGEAVTLAVISAEVLAAELYADSLEATLRRAFALYHDRPLLLERTATGYATAARYGEVWERAMALARGLAARLELPESGESGIPGRIALAVMLPGGLPWVLADLAALHRGYVILPIAPGEPEDRIATIFARTRPSCVLCEARDTERVRRTAPGALVICVPDGLASPGFAGARSTAEGHCGEQIAALCAAGAAAMVPEPASREPDELHGVLFTSGSTGEPKGAMRSYRGFFELVKSHPVGHSPRHLSFQPLSHLSERMYLPALLVHGGTVAYSRGGAHLLDELRAFEPTTIGTVPRLFEVLHATYRRRLAALLAHAGPTVTRGECEARALAEARASFGGRLVAISIGSAPVSAEVLAFLRRCFADLWVSEGYGSTEVGVIASDGRVPEGVIVKLVPRPGAEPPRPGEPEIGEIFVLSPHAITGYLGDPEASAAAFDAAGYFATGDLGERDPATGQVRVIGRVRNTVKLAQGEFVTPERIEAALTTAPIVDRIFVHAEPGAAGVTAVVVPVLAELARALDVAPDRALDHPDAAAAVRAALRAHARELASYELPCGIVLEAGPFSSTTGELTPSGKLARGTLTTRYRERLIAASAAPAASIVRSSRGRPAEGAVEDASIVPAGDELAEDLRARVLRIAGQVIGLGSADAMLHRPGAPGHAFVAGLAGADGPLAGSDGPLAGADGLLAGIDSLATAELLAALSAELGREIPLAWWFEVRTLGELADRLSRFAPAAAPQLPALAADDLVARPLTVTRPRTGPVGRVLLTGATGLLGAHLVEALHERGIAAICLVRAPDDVAATARLEAALARYQVSAPRPRALAGDLASVDLAAQLVRPDLEVDAIIHAGATVSWLAPYAALRACNVHGTRALLELAARAGLAFHHVSTISTAPADGDEDSRLALAQVAGLTPYALSKWIAEDHVRRAADAGLPVAIYRPAMIAGHSQRGVGNPDDFVNRYLAGCGELGLYIEREDAVLDLTPVDFVARAIATLVAARVRGTYHLANVDQSPSFAALGRALVAAGEPVAPAPYPRFREALAAHATCRLQPLAAFFPESFTLGMGPWPCDRTVALLEDHGVVRPRIDDAIVARYVAALRRGQRARAC